MSKEVQKGLELTDKQLVKNPKLAVEILKAVVKMYQQEVSEEEIFIPAGQASGALVVRIPFDQLVYRLHLKEDDEQ